MTSQAPPPPDPALDRIRSEIRGEARGAVDSSLGLRILTGGQTGVDTMAAVEALAAGFRPHVVFPRGYLQEDGPLTAERRQALDGAVLHQLTATAWAARTWSCVRLADAVILIDRPAAKAAARQPGRRQPSAGRCST